MTITVDEKLVEIARCLADTAAQLNTSSLPMLAIAFEKASQELLAQAIKSSETVRVV